MKVLGRALHDVIWKAQAVHFITKSIYGLSFIKLIKYLAQNQNLRTTIMFFDYLKVHYYKKARAMMSELRLEVCFMLPSSVYLKPVKQV